MIAARYNNQALASVGLRRCEAEAAGPQLDQLTSDLDCLRAQVDARAAKCGQLTSFETAENGEPDERLLPGVDCGGQVEDLTGSEHRPLGRLLG